MTKLEPSRLPRHGELIARVAGREEVLLSDDSESMWLEVIRKMDEVYSDLINYETDLERKNAELEEARGFIASVVASVSDVLVVCDESGVVVQVNPAFKTLMDLPEGALIGRPFGECFAPQDRERVQAMLGCERGNEASSGEFRFATAHGSSDLMAMNCSTLFNSDGRRAGAVFTGRPVGELRRAYEALHHAHVELQQAQSRLVEQEKMASLGRLVAGVAHELNNPISFVYGNIHALNRYRIALAAYLSAIHSGACVETRETLRRRHHIDAILEDLEPLIHGTLEGAVRISEIVKNLRRLSFSSKTERAPVDLSKVVRTASQWAARSKKTRAKIETRLEPELCALGQEGQIYSVIGNVIDNALDAVKGVRDPWVAIETRSEAEFAVVEVSDNGPGVDESVRARIFEPFFTTKQAGEGTGLGLWICYSIVHEHGGAIECGNRAEGGARMTLRFPHAGAGSSEASSATDRS